MSNTNHLQNGLYSGLESTGPLNNLSFNGFPSPPPLMTAGPTTSKDNATIINASMSSEHRRNSTAKSERASPKSTESKALLQESEKNESGQPLPPWTELKTKAGKERKRLPLACIACRRKKIRCSGEHPACKHCLRSRIPCVYKVTTRKAAPRTDYMAMLDKRLKRMEERVIKIIPKEDQGIVSSTGRATVRPPTQQTSIPPTPPQLRRTSSTTTTTTTRKRTAEQSVADLETWSRADLQPPGQQVVLTTASSKTQEQDDQDLLHEGTNRLPPRDVQEHLAEIFFDFVYGQSYHLLHKPSFIRRMAQGDVPPVLMLAVCAMAARFSDHPAVRTEPAFLRGEEWAAPAREISLKRYDSPNITILIVYLILTLHEFGTCQGGRSWMFAGMAQRMAYAMQLHHDLATDPKARHSNKKVKFSDTDREIRRRTMWACFMTDRYCSSGTERPTFISVNHLRLQLPIREDYFQMELTGPTEDLTGKVVPPDSPADQLSNAPDNMGVAAFMIRIVAIWGDCIDYYNMGGKAKDQHPMWDERSRFHELRNAVQKWQDHLPDRLQYRPDNLATHASEKIANQFIFMHIIYHQTSLFVHRFALPLAAAQTPNTTGIPTAFVQSSAKAALDAANSISELVHDGMDYNVVAPFAGYSAFFSSTVHIQGAFSKNKALAAASNKHLTWNINYLTRMKKHWGMFHFMTENLRDLYRKHVDVVRKATPQDGDKADAIFQYGDWFDRYPHGVNGADYDEPQSDVKKEPGADAGLGQRSDLQTVEEFFSARTPLKTNTPRGQKPRKSAKKTTADDPGPSSLQYQQDITGVYDQLDLSAGLDNSTMYPDSFQTNLYPTTQMNDAFSGRPGSLPTFTNFDGSSTAMSYAMPGAAYDPLALNLNFDSGLGSMPDLTAGQASYQAAASGGWFMPLNLDAAALAEASGPFSTGSFDWSSQFDLSNLQASSLTPGTLAELDNQTGDSMR